MRRLNWKPIQNKANEAAKLLGHTLGSFESHRNGQARNSVKMASCEICYGCCWIAYTANRGFGAGGRLLIFRCGTSEAMGLNKPEVIQS